MDTRPRTGLIAWFQRVEDQLGQGTVGMVVMVIALFAAIAATRCMPLT